MAGIDWGKLYEQGRCKAIGIPWSEEEANAVYSLKIPVAYVRQGCLTLDEYKKTQLRESIDTEKDGKVQLLVLKKSQLLALCKKNGIEATPDAIRPVLIEQLLLKGIPKRILVSEVPAALENEV